MTDKYTLPDPDFVYEDDIEVLHNYVFTTFKIELAIVLVVGILIGRVIS